MNRIQKVSAYFLILLKGLVVAIPSYIVFNWLFVGTTLTKNKWFSMNNIVITPEAQVNLHEVAWEPLSQAIGMGAHMFGALPVFLSLFVLIAIFKNYQKGDIFSAINAKYYRFLGWLFFFDAFVAQPLYEMLMTLATTMSNPPGQRYISISIGTPNIEALFCGGVLIIISWVMLEASKLHDDQQYTV